MLIFIPILLLIFGSIAITIIYRLKSRIGLTWLIAAGSTFFAWLILVYLRFFLPTDVPLIDWTPSNLFYASPYLMIDYVSWPYAMALLTIEIAYIFTDSARAQDIVNPMSWAGSMAITAIGLMALLAGNPLTMVLAWALVDIIEFIYLISIQQNDRWNRQIIILFALRVLSLIIFSWATMVGWLDVGQFDIDDIPNRSGVYFLIAGAIRLGVFSINTSFFKDLHERRGSGILLRLAPIASSLGLIARMPPETFTIRPYWVMPIQIMIGLVVFITALIWLLKENLYEASHYWYISLAAMAIICAINGQAEFSRSWGLALLLSGSLLMLFDPPIRRLRFLLIPGLLGMVALPYTMASSGWPGIFGQGISFLSISALTSHSLLIAGYMKFLLTGKGLTTNLESWSKISFPIGLIFIIQTQIALGIVGWPGVLSADFWWAGMVGLLLAITLLFVGNKLRNSPVNLGIQRKVIANQRIHNFFQFLNSFFSLTWVKSIFLRTYQVVCNLVLTVTRFIEGDSAILWAFVIIILLLSFLRIGD